MNKYIVSLIICVASFQTESFASWANADILTAVNAQKTTDLAVEEVAERVGKFNLSVYANALKVYQAKESIQVARGNLLPKLNLWRLAGNFNGVSPVMSLANTAGSLIEDIAPFLVPANWFRLKQVKLLYQSEQEGYRALWANEVMTAKSIFFHSVQDQSILEEIVKMQVELNEVSSLIETRAKLGAEPASNFILERVQERVLGLQEDRRNLELLLIEEKRTLSYMLGFPADQTLNLIPLETPEIFLAFKPRPVLEEQAIATSPELKQFDLLVQVADKVKKEVVFSFLGLSSLSRGVGGGVFDNLPIQDGLGFGTSASMRIVRTQKEILSVQKIAVAETLKRNLSNIISGWNLDLENHKNAQSRLLLAINVFEGMKEKLRLGQYVESLDLMDASRNKMQAEIALVALRCRLAGYKDRLARVLFEGDYNRPPSLEKFEEKAKTKIKSEKKSKKAKA